MRLFLVLIFSLNLLQANNLPVSKSKVLNGDNLWYYVDSSSVFDKPQKNPIHILKNANFIKAPKHLSLGYLTKDIWLKTTIINPTNDTLHNYILELENGLLEDVRLFQFQNTKLIQTHYSGTFLALNQRSFSHHLPSFKFNLPPGESVLLIYIGGINAKLIDVELFNQSFFNNQIRTKDLFFGLYLGVLIALLLYNLFLYFSIKESTYLHYILYIFNFLILNLVLDGYINLIFPNTPLFNTVIAVSSSGFAIGFSLLFTMRFLNVKSHFPKLYKWMKILCWGALGGVLLGISNFWFKDIPPYITLLIILAGLSIYVIAVLSYIKKVRSSGYFLVAWSFFLLGTFIISLVNFNAIPSNFFTNNALRITSVMEVVLLSFALADKIKWERKDKLLALQKLKDEEMNSKILESEKISSELKALKSQMNPHFIFNALNSIQEMFLLGDKELANEHLGKFSVLTRQILELSDKKFIALSDEIDMLDKYLSIEKIRFEENFDFTINVSDNLDVHNINIPPMLLQPFVENAIKHGVFHSKKHKFIEITFNSTPHFVECIIIDNGVGRSFSNNLNKQNKSKPSSFSSLSIQKRIDLINKYNSDKISVEISDAFPNQTNCGTKVKILFPNNF